MSDTRAAILADLGFASYAAYLRSELWHEIRERVLREAKRKCCCCGRPAWEVHHAAYTRENLIGSSLVGLYAVCGPCHRKIHIGRRGVQVSMLSAQARLDRLLRGRARKLAHRRPQHVS